MNIKKFFVSFVTLALLFCSCNDDNNNVVPNPEPEPPIKPKPLENATLLLTSKKGWNNGAQAVYRGHIMALRQDGVFVQDVFEKANPEIKEKTLGFNANSLTVKDNKVYVLSTKGHNDQAPQIYILNNETLKVEKIINLDPLVEEGVATNIERLHVVSSKKAYLFFYGSIYALDLEAGKLGKKLNGIDTYSRITYPFFEFSGKIHAVSYDDMERSIITIDPATDALAYTALGGDDKSPVHVMKDASDNLISLNKSMYGSDWNLSVISLATKKATKTIDISKGIGKGVALLKGEPVVFFNGAYDMANKTNDEKTIFRFNYETKKLEKFAKLKTKSPKSTIYNIRLFVHPQTKNLIAGVQDHATLKFIRTYDTKASKLPAEHKKEFLYDTKSMGVTEIVLNTMTEVKEK